MTDHVIGVFYRQSAAGIGNWTADCSCGWEKSTVAPDLAQRRALAHHREAQEVQHGAQSR